MAENARDFGISISTRDRPRGIVHIIGPNGASPCRAPRSCAAIATATHGAFGALAHGIGTSSRARARDQTLIGKSTCVWWWTASCRPASPRRIILTIIGEIGMAGGTDHVIEYTGEAIRALSMEAA